jgi:hypothetical protein
MHSLNGVGGVRYALAEAAALGLAFDWHSSSQTLVLLGS